MGEKFKRFKLKKMAELEKMNKTELLIYIGLMHATLRRVDDVLIKAIEKQKGVH